MDLRNSYFHEILKIIRTLDKDVRESIYLDLLKLDVWYLPEPEEMKYFVDRLFDISYVEWKFILKEFRNPLHCSIRNSKIAEILENIRKFDLKTKPFQIHHFNDYHIAGMDRY